jgi:hypothetical protein
MLFMQLRETQIAVADDVAAPLLDRDVIVSPVLCEALDYVKWAYN